MSGAVSDYQFGPTEQPTVPGGPFLPALLPARRLEYGVTGAIIAALAIFPNSLITVNVPNLPGPLGLDIAQVSWMPAIFVTIMATANLTVAKARIQFGFPRVTALVLVLNILAGLSQLAWPGFATAAATRVLNGVAAASLIALSMYYLLQAFPPSRRAWASLAAIGMILGAIVGAVLHATLTPEAASEAAGYFSLVTDIFLRLIRMIIAPLVFATLIPGIAHLGDSASIGRIGAKTLGWFLCASMVSLLLGLFLANLLHPGVGLNLPIPPRTPPRGWPTLCR